MRPILHQKNHFPAKTEVLSRKKYPKKCATYLPRRKKCLRALNIHIRKKILPPPASSLKGPKLSASLKNERTLSLQGFSLLNISYLWAKMFFVAKWVAHAWAVCCSWGNNLFGICFLPQVDVDCCVFGECRLLSFDLNLWVPCQSWNTMGSSERIMATQNIILIFLRQLWRLKKV